MATTKHIETKVGKDGKVHEVEVFVFHNPSKRKKARREEEVPKKTVASKSKVKGAAQQKVLSLQTELELKPTFSLKTARHDVRNLGITGFSGRTKIEAQLAQLKSLGAEIPKNWQRRMDRRKRNEEFERRKQDLKAGLKTKKLRDPNKSAGRSQPKKKEEDVFFDGQVGKYKDGVQYISAADIQKIRNSASKR